MIEADRTLFSVGQRDGDPFVSMYQNFPDVPLAGVERCCLAIDTHEVPLLRLQWTRKIHREDRSLATGLHD